MGRRWLPAALLTVVVFPAVAALAAVEPQAQQAQPPSQPGRPSEVAGAESEQPVNPDVIPPEVRARKFKIEIGRLEQEVESLKESLNELGPWLPTDKEGGVREMFFWDLGPWAVSMSDYRVRA